MSPTSCAGIMHPMRNTRTQSTNASGLPRLVRLLSLALVISLMMPGNASSAASPLRAGTKAPSFTTITLSGRPLSLMSLRGHVVLLDYWATWCAPCVGSMPKLQALHRRFEAQGLRVVGLSLDDASTMPTVKQTLKSRGITYCIGVSVVDNARAAQAYNVTYPPSLYLIDKKGIVRWSSVGLSAPEQGKLKTLIEGLVHE